MKYLYFEIWTNFKFSSSIFAMYFKFWENTSNFWNLLIEFWNNLADFKTFFEIWFFEIIYLLHKFMQPSPKCAETLIFYIVLKLFHLREYSFNRTRSRPRDTQISIRRIYNSRQHRNTFDSALNTSENILTIFKIIKTFWPLFVT